MYQKKAIPQNINHVFTGNSRNSFILNNREFSKQVYF